MSTEIDEARHDTASLVRSIVMGKPDEVANRFLSSVCYPDSSDISEYQKELSKCFDVIKCIMHNYSPERKAAVRSATLAMNVGYWVNPDHEPVARHLMDEYLPC